MKHNFQCVIWCNLCGKFSRHIPSTGHRTSCTLAPHDPSLSPIKSRRPNFQKAWTKIPRRGVLELSLCCHLLGLSLAAPPHHHFAAAVLTLCNVAQCIADGGHTVGCVRWAVAKLWCLLVSIWRAGPFTRGKSPGVGPFSRTPRRTYFEHTAVLPRCYEDIGVAHIKFLDRSFFWIQFQEPRFVIYRIYVWLMTLIACCPLMWKMPNASNIYGIYKTIGNWV